jgi:glycerophosphoryl diester phosphodiesterase
VTSIFAHRGHHVNHPENSLAAVQAARDLGAEGVEIDVWLSTDDYLVINHDRTLNGRALPTTTFAELTSHTQLAQLHEVLDQSGTMTVNVEIKSTRSPGYNLRVARAVSEFLDSSAATSRCLVSSFSLAICHEVRRLSPHRRVGWLVERRSAPVVLNEVAHSALTSAHFAFSRVNASVVEGAQQLGVEVHVWTPNRRGDLERMFDLGVDAVITDDVVLAQELRQGRRGSTDE